MICEFWDSQFKFSQILADFQIELQRMDDESNAFSSGRNFQRTAYGDDPRQWVETTTGKGNKSEIPVVIHGGYWRALAAESHRFMMAGYEPSHAVVANVEYRLLPTVRMGDVVADIANALVAIAQAHPGAGLVLVGHSAGAHLALSAIADERVAKSVRGIVALSGVYDLEPVTQSFLQPELQLTPDEVQAHSHAPSRSRPPVLYVNGSMETHEFLRASAMMASRGRCDWRVIEGANHMTLPREATGKATELLQNLHDIGETR